MWILIFPKANGALLDNDRIETCTGAVNDMVLFEVKSNSRLSTA
jgi:hypothetical protein